eukprot:UN34583
MLMKKEEERLAQESIKRMEAEEKREHTPKGKSDSVGHTKIFGGDPEFEKKLSVIELPDYPVLVLSFINWNYYACDQGKWKSLTSPPHDQEVFRGFCESYNIPLFMFEDLTGKQFVMVFNQINKILKQDTSKEKNN